MTRPGKSIAQLSDAHKSLFGQYIIVPACSEEIAPSSPSAAGNLSHLLYSLDTWKKLGRQRRKRGKAD